MRIAIAAVVPLCLKSGMSASRFLDELGRRVLVCDGAMHDYAVKVGSHPQWAGKRITGLRLDPGSGPAGVTIRIDAVRGM